MLLVKWVMKQVFAYFHHVAMYRKYGIISRLVHFSVRLIAVTPLLSLPLFFRTIARHVNMQSPLQVHVHYV